MTQHNKEWIQQWRKLAEETDKEARLLDAPGVSGSQEWAARLRKFAALYRQTADANQLALSRLEVTKDFAPKAYPPQDPGGRPLKVGDLIEWANVPEDGQVVFQVDGYQYYCALEELWRHAAPTGDAS